MLFCSKDSILFSNFFQIMEEMRMILQKSPGEMDKLMNKAKKEMQGLEKLVPKNTVDSEVSLL